MYYTITYNIDKNYHVKAKTTTEALNILLMYLRIKKIELVVINNIKILERSTGDN